LEEGIDENLDKRAELLKRLIEETISKGPTKKREFQ
jgi:hypothetical protein